MPRVLSVNEYVTGKRDNYRVVDDNVPHGGQAMNYYVVDSAGANRFMKMFIEPTRRSPHADEFVKRQKLLMDRLAEIPGYVCQDVEFFEADGTFFKVQERMTGDTLCDRLQKAVDHPEDPQYWSQSNRLANATVLARTLAEVHAHGVAHLDLKPENCYLAERRLSSTKDVISVIRLLDFDSGIVDGAPAPRQMLCTPKYQSPEHVVPGVYGLPGKHSDVFALGVMLYEMLARQYPFETRTGFLSRAARHPHELAPWLPLEIADIIWQALDPVAVQRPSAHQVYQRLVARPSDRASDGNALSAGRRSDFAPDWHTPEIRRTQPAAVVPPSPPPPAQPNPAIRIVSERPGPVVDAHAVWVVLLAPGRRIRIWKDGYLGRELLRGVMGYQDVSAQQAKVYRGPSGWTIEALSGTIHPLQLNGDRLKLGENYILHSGDTIRIGRLEVAVDFEPVDAG